MTRTSQSHRALFAALSRLLAAFAVLIQSAAARGESEPAGALEAAAAPPQGLEVVLRSVARIEGETLKLADVAEFRGEDPELIGLLSELDLGAAPKPGAPARLSRSRVEKAITQAAPSATGISVSGAQEVSVERRTMRICMALLREELAQRLKAQLPYEAEKVSVSQIQLPEEITLPWGRLKLDVEFQFSPRLLGQTAFSAFFNVDERLARRITGTMVVDMESTAHQAIRMIPRGERLKPEDFKQVAWAQSRLPRNALSAFPAEQTAAKAKDNIQPGQILTGDMIERAALVKRNDALTLRIRRGPLIVTASALAKEPGAAGEVIRTVNLQSQKEIFARLIDSQTAEVVY